MGEDLGKAGRLLEAALAIGVLTGCVELLVIAYKTFITHDGYWLSGQVIWMAPLAAAVLFALIAVPFLLLLLTPVRRRVPLLALAAFVFVAVMDVLLMFALHRIAALVLAAGIASQVVPRVLARPDRFLRYARVLLVVLVSTVALAGAAVNGWWRLQERRSLASLPAAGRAAPNILLLILDTVRAQSLGLYGYDRPTTPRLEQFARRGVVFERAFAPSPWTLPTHASILTGRWPHELSTGWQTPLDSTFPTLAEELATIGYATGGFVANIPYTNRRQGLARGFARYQDYPLSVAQVVLSSSLGRVITNNGTFRRLIRYQDILNRKRARDVNRELLDWIGRVGNRPFFVFANYYDAHEPLLPQQGWRERFGPTKARQYAHFTVDAWLPDRDKLPAEELALERNAYDASIAELDDGIGALLDELERRRLLDNTIVIITSDHGDQFGEHGLVDHGNSLYKQVVHVPLILSFPGHIPAHARVGEPVSLRDLPATILELVRHPRGLPGESFATTWHELPVAPNPARRVAAEVALPSGDTLHSVLDERYHLIRTADGTMELYDYVADPAETMDLAASAAHASVLRQLSERLRTPVSHAAR
jgi:arylsulfatase A-like enzyme